MTAARRAAAVVVESGEYDDALALLALQSVDSQQALEILVESLDSSGVVRRFAGAALLDKAAVDDVSQDSLISVVESIGSYRGNGKVTTWVHTIVRRRVVDYLRRQREATALTDEMSPAARMSSMIAARATVQQALAKLPRIYRDPVTLRDIEGLTYARIAEELELSLGTVKSQVSRGRAMVAAQLQSHDSSGAGG